MARQMSSKVRPHRIASHMISMKVEIVRKNEPECDRSNSLIEGHRSIKLAFFQNVFSNVHSSDNEEIRKNV